MIIETGAPWWWGHWCGFRWTFCRLVHCHDWRGASANSLPGGISGQGLVKIISINDQPCYGKNLQMVFQVKAFLPAGEEEGKEVTAADLKVLKALWIFFFFSLKRMVCPSRSVMLLILKQNVCSPRAQCSRLSSSRQSPCFQWHFSLARLHPW